jgi:hypothetical protein
VPSVARGTALVDAGGCGVAAQLGEEAVQVVGELEVGVAVGGLGVERVELAAQAGLAGARVGIRARSSSMVISCSEYRMGIFSCSTAGFPHIAAIGMCLNRLAGKAGSPGGFTPHSLRHALVSALLSREVPITDVAAWLGHRNISVTYATYGHLAPSSLGCAQEVLNAEYAECSVAAWRSGPASRNRAAGG